MKTHFLAVVSAALLVASACNPQPKESRGGAVTTPSTIAGSVNETLVAANERDVQIEIYENPEKAGEYLISGPIPSVVCLTRRKDKIKWCIIASSCWKVASWSATVRIDGFRNPTITTKKNPFGDNSDFDNLFYISNVVPGTPDCTRLTQLATGAEGYYKYTIHVTVIPSGGTPIALPDLDPGAVLAD